MTTTSSFTMHYTLEPYFYWSSHHINSFYQMLGIQFATPTEEEVNMAKDYVSGSPIRQEYLEKAIKWIADRDGFDTIEKYMALHQHDENANQIWIYFKRVIEWVETIFPNKRSKMKGVEWGLLYNKSLFIVIFS